MKIWLDDLRPAPEGWLWVKDAESAVLALDEYGEDVAIISLDHDLGDVERNTTGYDVLLWIEERLSQDPSMSLPLIHFHADNPISRARMWAATEKIYRMKFAANGALC